MDRLRALGLAGVLAILTAASPAFPQTIDVPAFQAGAPTFADSLQEIDVAPHQDGGFVLTWMEWDSRDLGPSNRIVTHRFTRSGVETAPPVRVDSSGYGLYPSIVSDGAGAFLASWDWSSEGVARALFARRLNSAGAAAGIEQRVDNPNSGPMVSHATSYRDSGPVYFWKQNGLWIRAFDRFGSSMTPAIRVGDNVPGFELDIDALPGGGVVVVWTNRWASDWSWARIYDASLAPTGPAFAIETVGRVERVATSSTGRIAIVGEAIFDATTGGAGGPRSEVWLRFYDANGTPEGPRQVVRTAASSFSMLPDAAFDSRGNLMVVWREYDSASGVAHPARARAYRADGSAIGADLPISALPAHEIDVTALADDCFAAAWYRIGTVEAAVLCLCGTDPSCGDGIVDAMCEVCDDGNLADGDGCDANCTPSDCGNGMVGGDERCDDGNLADGDGCDSNCTPSACGNGIVAGTELCDDGNLADDDGCDSNCRPSGCGNGRIGAGEECDDGNAQSGDGCDADCTISACGNGITAGREECDDGNLADGDGCDSNCRLPGCGNGVRAGEEECDDGGRASGDGCDANCWIEDCGNGRIEANEQCDPGSAPESGAGACNEDCTLRSIHDSVVFAVDPIEMSIPVGNSPFTGNVIVQVQNADVKPAREMPGHAIRLVASDGDCPEGTVTGQPDFDRGTPGAQDTTIVAGGNPATAIADVTISREAFAPFDHNIPTRCTLRFTATEAGGGSDDPTPDNNSVAVALDVTDTDDPANPDHDEFFVESMRPVTIRIPAGSPSVHKTIKPAVRRSRDIPVGSAELEVTVGASDGDCPSGTIGFFDLDRRTAGMQTRVRLKRGKRAKGTMGLVIRADAFDSPSDESPRRCTALITATGDGDTDPSNNTTRLVIDVVDRNDF